MDDFTENPGVRSLALEPNYIVLSRVEPRFWNLLIARTLNIINKNHIFVNKLRNTHFIETINRVAKQNFAT
ncbi:hypothetical protein CP500_012020 [Tychonema bourrellyi FEM_GT703]|uniref:Uncharacterized protein n=1 Tax=Tychonema bourrellyi FEM_GT703 TaxID=2040638 RepID=A0A2G4F178_9CYAN|nr:hypothetical protein CP500_012020 [Tychonema bourrellyi FEM_GT703]